METATECIDLVWNVAAGWPRPYARKSVILYGDKFNFNARGLSCPFRQLTVPIVVFDRDPISSHLRIRCG